VSVVGLAFSPVPAHVRTARMLSVAIGRRSGLPDELLDEVRLAVNEACIRAVAVHGRLRRDDEIKVEFCEDSRGYQISIADVGPLEDATPASLDEPFSPSSDAMAASIELAIVSGLVEDVQLKAGADGGTVVVLRWNR